MSSGAIDEVESVKTRAAMMEALTRIWQRVLAKPAIAADDNFFAIRGTDAQADQVFAEISTEFNRPVPAATICYAPTIAGLAALLEQPVLPKFSPMIPLKAGSNPSIFIAPGVGGRASFYDLAQHIETENAIYGIQARGVDGREDALESIEEMAELYLGALREVQPSGPYFLIGYSFGGLLALEMAQRLRREKNEVALLAMVDTYPDPRYLPVGERLLLFTKKVEHKLSDLSRGSGVKAGDGKELRQGLHPLSFTETMLQVKWRDFVAMKRYRPQFYEGKIQFVRPAASPYLPNNPAAVWKNLAAEFELETVSGDHLGMVASNFKTLAAVLTRYVREASRG
jgi:acetoacetyl-CoA synthetase